MPDPGLSLREGLMVLLFWLEVPCKKSSYLAKETKWRGTHGEALWTGKGSETARGGERRERETQLTQELPVPAKPLDKISG